MMTPIKKNAIVFAHVILLPCQRKIVIPKRSENRAVSTALAPCANHNAAAPIGYENFESELLPFIRVAGERLRCREHSAVFPVRDFKARTAAASQIFRTDPKRN